MANPKKPRLPEHHKDWHYAFQQYRAGRSIQDCADDIGVTRAVLFDRISKEGITYDLGAAIASKTTDILAGAMVDANGRLPTSTEDIVQINATLQASIVRSHRSDIDRFRKLTMAFLDELEGMTMYQDVLDDLGTILRSENKAGEDKLNDAYKKIISLPGRTETLKKLGDTLKTLIGLERQAFGMRDDYEDDEIRKSRVDTAPPADRIANFDSIIRKFTRVMGRAEEVTDVESRPIIPAA